jgi:hypothetical protein
MSDKSLDATGFDSSRGMGKHDFVESPSGLHVPCDASDFSNVTSNVANIAPAFSLDRLLEAIQALKKIAEDPEKITHAHCGSRYLAALMERVSQAEMRGGFASAHGFRFTLDPDVPPEVIEYRNFKNEVVYADSL